jgi:hypothetical protein
VAGRRQGKPDHTDSIVRRRQQFDKSGAGVSPQEIIPWQPVATLGNEKKCSATFADWVVADRDQTVAAAVV